MDQPKKEKSKVIIPGLEEFSNPGSVLTQESIEQRQGSTQLDAEERASDPTRGRLDLKAMLSHTSTAELLSMDYADSEAKKELERQKKEEFENTSKAISDVDAQIKEIESKEDNFQLPEEVGVKGVLGGKRALALPIKTLKPEVEEQVQQLKNQKKDLAMSATDNPELEKINSQIKFLQDKYSDKMSKKDTDFLDSPLDWWGEVYHNTVATVKNTFSDPEKKMTSEEKIQYNKLKATRDTFYKPIAEEKYRQLDEQEINLGARAYEGQAGNTLGDKLQNLNVQWQLRDAKREVEAYLNDEGGTDAFIRKLGGVTGRVDEAGQFRGFTDMVHNVHDYIFKDELMNKTDRVGYANLDAKEKQLLEAYADVEETKNFLSDKQKWSYNMVDQTTHSLGFVRDIAIADALTAGFGGFLGVGSGTASRVAIGALKKTGSKLVGQIAAGTVNAGRLGVSIGVQQHLNPGMLNEELMKGSHVQRDEQGNIQNIYVKEGLYDYMEKIYKDEAKALESDKKRLEKKGTLSEEEAEELRRIKVRLGEESSFGEHSLAEELALLKPKSGMEAEIASYGKTASERIAEIYTAKGLSLLGKGLSKVPGVNKFTTAISKGADDLSVSFKGTKLGRFYDNVNKTAGRALRDSQGNPIINSIPEEIVEEYVTAGLNSLQDWDAKELEDMFNVQANLDIGAQTLLMSTLFATGGSVQTNAKLGYNKIITQRLAEYEDRMKKAEVALKSDPANTELERNYLDAKVDFEDLMEKPSITGLGITRKFVDDATFSSTRSYADSRKEIRDKVTALKRANTDEEVNKLVNLTTTQGFSINEQQLKIKSLRSEGKVDEANLVEKAMFQKLVLQSFRGGVQDEFQASLKSIQQKEGVSEQTKRNAIVAEGQMAKLKDVYKRNESKPNLGEIINLSLDRFSAEQGIQDLEEDKGKIEADVRTEIDSFIQAGNFSVDYSLSNLFTRTEFPTPEAKVKYDKFLESLSEYKNTAIENYLGLDNAKEVLGQHLSRTRVALNEALHPSLETLNKQKFAKQIEQDINDIVEGNGRVNNSYAEFLPNNKFKPTVQFIEELFANRRSEFVGNTNEGKISDSTFLNMREEAKRQIIKRQEFEKIARLFERQQELRDKNVVTETEVEELPTVKAEIEQSPVEIIDEKAETTFSDAIQIVEADVFNMFGPQEGEPDIILGDDTTVSDLSKKRKEELDNIKTLQPIRLDMSQSEYEELLVKGKEDIEKQTKEINDRYDALEKDSANIISDDEFDSMIGVDEYTPEQLAFVKKAMSDVVNTIQEITGQETVSFKEAISQYYKYFTDKNNLRANFRHFAKGWRENGYKVENSEIVTAYDSLFKIEGDALAVEEGIINLFNTRVSPQPTNSFEELETKTEVSEREIKASEKSVVSYDEENMPLTKSEVQEISSNRTVNILPKLGFSSIAYEEVIENGILSRRTVGERLNQEDGDLIDFRDLLNPDLYPTGATINTEVAPENLWSQITVSNGRNEKGEVQTTTFDNWLSQREAINPNFRSTQEFTNKVPMFYTDVNGKKLAYVQDTDWYNPYNVANPYGDSKDVTLPTPEWVSHINEGKANTQDLRTNISRGMNQVTISRPSAEGTFYKIPETEPLISLNESNPSSRIAVQRGLTLEGLDPGFANGTKKLLNKPEDFEFTNGHTWSIYRMGLAPNDKGEMIETYRAFPINRNVSQEQIDTVRWALAANSAFMGSSLPGKYRMTKEQALDMFIKPLNKKTGLNISNPQDLMEFIKLHFQLSKTSAIKLRRPNDTREYDANSLVLYKRLLLEDNSRLEDPTVVNELSQHSNSKYLKAPSFKAVNLTARGVEPILDNGNEISYEQYLKNTLLINIKSFNVGSSSTPVYATVIQPILNVQYTAVSESVEPTPQQRREEAAAQAILEIVPQEFDIDTHLNFLNSIGVDIESFEDSDSLIENTDKLADLFNLTGDLNVVQEKAIRQYLVHSIAEKASFQYKASIDRTKLMNEAKTEFNLSVRALENKMKTLLDQARNYTGADTRVASLIQAYEATLSNIETVRNSFEEVFSKAFEDIKKQTQLVEIEVNDTEERELDDDETINEKDYNKESIEESGKSKASYRLRRFLHKIQKYDSQGNPQTTYLGLPEYMTFNDTYNELTKVLAMGSEIVSDYDLMIDKLKQSKSPFIKDVLRKLDSADQQIKNEFLYNFVRHSLSSKFAMFETSNRGASLKIYDTNSNEITRVVRAKWINEAKASNLYKSNGDFNKDYAEALILRFVEISTNPDETPQEEFRLWLEDIGLFMEDATWETLYSQGIFNSGKQTSFKELYTQNKGGLFIPIINFLNKGIAKPEEFNFERNNNVFSDLVGVVNALSLIEANNNPQLVALSFRDSGKNISTQVPTKFVTDMVQNLKRAVNDENGGIITQLQKLSLSEDSLLLKLLSEEPTFKSILEISHVGLTAIKQRGTNPTKSGVTDLGDIDYDLLTITGMQDRKVEKLPSTLKVDGISLRVANMLFPTMSDKSTALFLKTAVYDFLKDSDLLFNKAEDGTATMSFEVKELLFKNLVLPELKRIVKFHNEVKATNIKGYDKAAALFHFLPVMNTLRGKSGELIITELATTENYTLENILEDYEETFTNAIENVIMKEVQEKKNLWSAYKDTTAKGFQYHEMMDSNFFTEVGKDPMKDFEIGVFDYVLNSMLFNAEVFKVFAGDIANYSQDKLFKGEAYSHQVADPNKYISINRQIGVNLGKRLALLIAPGNKIANSFNEEYNQIFLEDALDITENAEFLIKLYGNKQILAKSQPHLNRYRKASTLVNRYEQGEYFVSPERMGKLKTIMDQERKALSALNPEIDAYFDIESTDAQEYTTALEHVSVLHRSGRITPAEFKAITNKLLTDGRAGYLTKEELKLVLQPIKPVHTGTYVNEDWDVNRVVYIKSSSFPLLPQLTAGTKLDAFRLKMEDLEAKTGRFTRASFQTANKVGATKNTVNPFDVNSLDKIREYEATDLDSPILILNRNNFRIQQDVPFKSDKKADDKVSMGTQFFKLLFGDGMTDFNDFELDGQPITGRELYNHFNKAFATIVETKKQGLFSDLGLSTQGTVTNEELFIKKLQEMLQKEASSRGYSIKSLRGLNIEKLAAKAGYYHEFKTPLWLSSDSNRYESLLNSIITNRIMKHKLPGSGFIAGSESGFRLKDNLEGIDQSRIIYLDSYNGVELQGTKLVDGTIQKAQVFAPSKFKGPNKQLIDLFEGYSEALGEGKYLIKRENGTLSIKDGMIDPQLLNNFTFRTPTSSHVSGSSIEIVGFLPPESGDLMLVPKNFTKQKGLDYDIDKESAYMLNHITDYKTGAIRVLSEEDKFQATKKLRGLLEKETNALNSVYGAPRMGAFYDSVRFYFGDDFTDSMQNKAGSLAQDLAEIEREFDRKLAENEFIKAHLAVFNSSNPEVQKKINKVLSIDFAKSQADMFEQLNEEGNKNAKIQDYLSQDPGLSIEEAGERYEAENLNFTMLNYNYQKNKMSLGSIGKIAIGVYANYTTMNGLLQQSEYPVFIESKEGGPKPVTLGLFTSDGTLGVRKSIAPSQNSINWVKKHQRDTSEVFAEKENTATDNEKEQVLGRVGVDEATINVDSLLSLRGFDKDENGNAISYLLLSQPSIKALNSKRKAMKGVLGDYRADRDLIKDAIEELSNGAVTYTQSGGEMDLAFYFTDVQTKSPITIEGKNLTGEALLDGIKFNGQDQLIQAEVFMNYIELEKEAKMVSAIQKTLNANVLGKSMIESQIKYEKLKTIAQAPIANIEKLLGDFVEIEDTSTRPEGSYIIGDYYVTPTTPQGQIVINGLHLGNTVYKDFFPYQDGGMLKVISEIAAIQNKGELSDSTLVENHETIMEEVKKYLYSRKDNNIFNMEPALKRYEIFKDDSANTSLSSYLRDITKGEVTGFGKGIKALSRNTLIKSFTYETGRGDSEVSLIKYNNAATDNTDEESLYNSIPELVMLDAPLPQRNGQPYSTRLLAEDLVAYAFLEGGVQEATQFIKFIPVEFLESIGQYEDVKKLVDGQVVTEKQFVPANRKLQSFNPKRNRDVAIFEVALGMKEGEVSTFTKQFFQHNPDKAPKISYKDKRKVSGDSFVLAPDKYSTPPSFVAMKNRKGSVDTYTLYENTGGLSYTKVNLLGQIGVSEYDYRNDNAVSVRTEAIAVPTILDGTSQGTTGQIDINIGTTIRGLLNQIKNATLLPKYNHLTEAAKWLADYGTDRGALIMDDKLKAAGRAFKATGNIAMNPSYTTQISEEQTAMVFIHEFIHTISRNELDKYFTPDGTELRTDVAIPAYVMNLNIVFNQFKDSLEPGELQTLLDKLASKGESSLGSPFTDREKNLVYAGKNIREFLSIALTSPMFQEEMNKVEYLKTSDSIWDRIKKALMSLLDSVYPGLQQDSLAREAIAASMEFITEERMATPKAIEIIPVDLGFFMEEPSQMVYTGIIDIENIDGPADIEMMIENTEETDQISMDDLNNLPTFEPC